MNQRAAHYAKQTYSMNKSNHQQGGDAPCPKSSQEQSGSNAEQRSNPAESATTPEARAREAAEWIEQVMAPRSGSPDVYSVTLSALNAQREEDNNDAALARAAFENEEWGSARDRSVHSLVREMCEINTHLRAERDRLQATVDALYAWYDRDGSVGGASEVFESNRPK